jgi:hypothetical protein
VAEQLGQLSAVFFPSDSATNRNPWSVKQELHAMYSFGSSIFEI